MKKISTEEFDSLMLHGKGNTGSFRKLILAMQPGDAIIYDKKDWHANYSPTRILNELERKHQVKFERGSLYDRSGWAIKRVK